MRLGGRANTSAVVEEAARTVSIEMSVDELEKWRQFKNLALGDGRSSETQASSSSANFSGTWDWKKAWEGEYA